MVQEDRSVQARLLDLERRLLEERNARQRLASELAEQRSALAAIEQPAIRPAARPLAEPSEDRSMQARLLDLERRALEEKTARVRLTADLSGRDARIETIERGLAEVLRPAREQPQGTRTEERSPWPTIGELVRKQQQMAGSQDALRQQLVVLAEEVKERSRTNGTAPAIVAAQETESSRRLMRLLRRAQQEIILLGGRFPRNSERSTAEGHVHTRYLKTITILSGEVNIAQYTATPNPLILALNAESGTADTLTHIRGGRDAQELVIFAATGDTITISAGGAADNVLPTTQANVDLSGLDSMRLYFNGAYWIETTRSVILVRHYHSFNFYYHEESLVVNTDFNGKTPIQIPGSGLHGTLISGTVRVSAGTAGTGTNTIKLQTSSTLTGSRTDRATVNLGTNQEASASASWTPADNEYLWVRATAVGATAPKDVRAQFDVVEEGF